MNTLQKACGLQVFDKTCLPLPPYLFQENLLVRTSLIGVVALSQLEATWYKIQRNANKEKITLFLLLVFYFGVWLILLGSSMAYLVPCDLQLHNGH